MTAPSNPPIKIKFTTCVREPFAKTTKMADLKRLILECMRKVSPLLEKNDISLAEKYGRHYLAPSSCKSRDMKLNIDGTSLTCVFTDSSATNNKLIG